METSPRTRTRRVDIFRGRNVLEGVDIGSQSMDGYYSHLPLQGTCDGVLGPEVVQVVLLCLELL